MRSIRIAAVLGAAALCAALFAAAPAQAKYSGWGVLLASFESQAECQDALPYYAGTHGPLVYCAYANSIHGWGLFGPGD